MQLVFVLANSHVNGFDAQICGAGRVLWPRSRGQAGGGGGGGAQTGMTSGPALSVFPKLTSNVCLLTFACFESVVSRRSHFAVSPGDMELEPCPGPPTGRAVHLQGTALMYVDHRSALS